MSGGGKPRTEDGADEKLMRKEEVVALLAPNHSGRQASPAALPAATSGSEFQDRPRGLIWKVPVWHEDFVT